MSQNLLHQLTDAYLTSTNTHNLQLLLLLCALWGNANAISWLADLVANEIVKTSFFEPQLPLSSFGQKQRLTSPNKVSDESSDLIHWLFLDAVSASACLSFLEKQKHATRHRSDGFVLNPLKPVTSFLQLKKVTKKGSSLPEFLTANNGLFLDCYECSLHPALKWHPEVVK
jgi:hypothetical protein